MSELENRSIESIESETKKEKKEKRRRRNSDTCRHVMGVAEASERNRKNI